VGGEFWQVVAGRTVAGLGGAGMSVLVSILITGSSTISTRFKSFTDDDQIWFLSLKLRPGGVMSMLLRLLLEAQVAR